jgi:hypothetical protein
MPPAKEKQIQNWRIGTISFTERLLPDIVHATQGRRGKPKRKST